MKLRIMSRAMLGLGLSILWASPAAAVGRLPGGILQTLGWGYGPGYHAPKTPGTSWSPRCGPSCSSLKSNTPGCLAFPSVLGHPPIDPIWSGIAPVFPAPSSENKVNCVDPGCGFVRLPPVESFEVPGDAAQGQSNSGKSILPRESNVPASEVDSIPTDWEPSPSDRKLEEREPPDPTHRSEVDRLPQTEVSYSNPQTKFQYRYPPPHILKQ